MELNKLAEALKVLETSFGVDACIAAANEVYSSVYKSPESFTLADMIGVNEGLLARDIRNTLRDIVAESLAIAAGTFTSPTKEELEESFEYDFDIDRSAVQAMFPTAEKLLDNGIRFVELCNYKGESEGYMLEELSGSLKTYISKYNYI